MISAHQTELVFGSAPVVDTGEVAELVHWLEGHPGWATAAVILAGLGRPATEGEKRRIRGLASGSDGEVLSGQKGYCHIMHASAEEIHHAASWLEHQGKEMLSRGIAIRRRGHSILG